MKPIRTYRELAALCDARKARRTDPTPEQVARAMRSWPWRMKAEQARVARMFRRLFPGERRA
ncbi:MAG: hypothetical protein NUV51_09985 [Sulfuricaulis sp.]|nr:hypothetical protein [Sulfuricaulis sp.]